MPLFAGSLADMTKPFQDFVAGSKARAEVTQPPAAKVGSSRLQAALGCDS
jgi:hypothetical protein